MEKTVEWDLIHMLASPMKQCPMPKTINMKVNQMKMVDVLIQLNLMNVIMTLTIDPMQQTSQDSGAGRWCLNPRGRKWSYMT